jgi:hypothetical protein
LRLKKAVDNLEIVFQRTLPQFFATFAVKSFRRFFPSRHMDKKKMLGT